MEIWYFLLYHTRLSTFDPDCGLCGADMMKKIPHKIDMGAVYAVAPKQKNFASKEAFKEVKALEVGCGHLT